jgi:hypothetical protein
MCCKKRLSVLTVDVGPPKLRAWMAPADCMPRYLYYDDWLTVVAQWAKAPGIHYYVAGSIPAVTPRYCTKKIE